MTNLATALLGIPWAKIGGWLVKAKFWLIAVLKPFGAWGLLALCFVDSASIPLPFMDPLIVSYGVASPAKAVIYCFMAALGASLGSLLPYYLGRAGGELFLLKRINRERYERMRDRFERQEFLAILIPSMLPPPTPLKLFQFGAGVFEMKPLPFVLATFFGKLTQFMVCSLATIWFGATIAHTVIQAFHQHLNIVLSFAGLGLLLLALYIARRIFDKRKGIELPLEEAQ